MTDTDRDSTMAKANFLKSKKEFTPPKVKEDTKKTIQISEKAKAETERMAPAIRMG
ncbi:hypothetical protein ACFL1S_04055 [Pseudomonadota bacterium]